MRRLTLVCAVLVLAALSFEASARPNIVLIMGDDIGFSDIGPFGSEIATPALDALAENGLRFTQFYNMAKCESTRTSIFTGLYFQKRNAERAANLAGMLRDAGYFTAMVGKEHFSPWVPDRLYARHHFDRSLTYWAINQYFVPTDGEWQFPYVLNGEEISHAEMPVNDPPFYKTDVLTDYALRFLDEAVEEEKPFFLYLPYHAAHYPLQAREEDIAKYRGRYLSGWDAIRAERLERARGLGVISPDARLSEPTSNINRFRGPYRREIYDYRPWAELDPDERDELDLEMAVFAAMVDRMDQNIARIVAKLDAVGARDDTLIVYLSDNGSCPYDSNRDFSIPPGGPASYRTLSAAWANAGNTPFRYFKQYGHEGGGHTHFIASWPSAIKPGLTHAPAHVVDLLPTFIDMAEAEYAGAGLPELDGASLLPVFRGATRSAPEIIVTGFTERFRGVRFGDWKIVRTNGEEWALFDLARDPTEMRDLALTDPQRLERLVDRYQGWVREQAAVVPLFEEVTSQAPAR